MRVTGRIEAGLVTAAQAGDRRALDELVAAGLPLVYTIVRRALSGHADADDVVQDTMLRAVRQLPALHSPESFRPWLAAIAVHQVSTHLRRHATLTQRATTLDEAAEVPDIDAAFEDLTMLRLELSAQRHQVTRASRWLDPADRALLSLWWLEVAGELTRTELAAALHLGVAHAGVRVQRMRRQLDASRALVAALDARPRCATLQSVLADWDGAPSPLWRKRITRHTRSCHVCRPATEGMIAAERLLMGFALLPVPIGLTAALLGKTTLTATAAKATSTAAVVGASGGAQAGLFAPLMQTVTAHPLVAALTAGALVAGTAITVSTVPASAPPPASRVAIAPTPPATTRAAPSFAPPRTAPSTRAPATTTAASPPATGAGTLTRGRPASLESTDEPGQFVTTAEGLGVLTPIGPNSTDTARRQATFTVSAGLANAQCFSFRAQDGRYLRHASWRFRLDADQGTALFRGDATFCVRPGATADSITLEAGNYPGWFLHNRNGQLWVDQADGSTGFRAESSFRIRPALAG